MNNESPGKKWDSKFLMMLAKEVFGEECLSESSVFGRLAWNSKVRHTALNKDKLKFVQGNIDVALLLSLRYTSELFLNLTFLDRYFLPAR